MYCIPRSIKTTCIKPSGTVSLIAGATPGMHYPKSKYYIRRMRIATNSDLTYKLKKQGYPVEPEIAYKKVVSDSGVESYTQYDNPDTSVISFPVCSGENVRTEESVCMWEQLNLASFLQKYWADNQVSCTVTFDPEREGPQMPYALNYFQYMLKGISFLPRLNYNQIYKQAPYEEINEEVYNEMMALINTTSTGEESPLNGRVRKGVDPLPELYCDGDKCVL